MGPPKKSTPRVREHVDKLREAGLDTQKFFDALVGIRDDTALPRAHREALYNLVAMESFVWYMEALRDERIDRVKLAEQVNTVGAEYEAAIRKQGDGDKAAALVERDIGAGRPPPKGTTTDGPAAPRNSPRAAPRAGGPRSKGPAPRKARAPGPRKKS